MFFLFSTRLEITIFYNVSYISVTMYYSIYIGNLTHLIEELTKPNGQAEEDNWRRHSTDNRKISVRRFWQFIYNE